MLSRIIGWVRGTPQQRSASVLATSEVKNLVRGEGPDLQTDPTDPLADLPRYPPYDTGIPIKSVDQIVASQRELTTRIYRTAGVSREEFQARYEPVIRNLARYVHLLPATSISHHRGAGGLFRLSLELGLHTLQGANAAVFPAGNVERRFFMTPKWSLGTFLAGVCCQLYRTVNNMVIVDRHNHQWAPMLMPLHDWAQSVKTDVFFIRWVEDRNQASAQASSAYLVNQIVPPEVLQYLSEDNNQVIPLMTAAITGAPIGSGDNTIAKIVAPVITRVIEEDLKRSSMNYGHLSIGVHLEPHLIDAMRRLVKSGWAWNSRTGCLWVGAEGAFIEWATAAQDIVNLLTRDSFAGVPRDQDTLAEMLCEAGVFERTAQRSKYWSITRPDTAAVVDGMVKFKHRDLIFPSGFDFAPYEQVLLTLTAPAPAPAKRAEVTPAPAQAKKADAHQSAIKGVVDTETGEIKPVSEEGAEKKVQNAPHKQHQEKPGPKPTPAAAATAVKTVEEPRVHEQEKPHTQQSQVDESPMPERLLAALKKENAWLLREIHGHYKKGKLTGTIVSLPQGLGISHEELTAHGQPVLDLLEELSSRNWLWQDKAKPLRKIHLIENGGRQMRFMVLKPDIANGLGFQWEG